MDRPVAPYVISWTGESTTSADVVITPAGVAYPDPAQDTPKRDLDNVLWELCGGTATGQPRTPPNSTPRAGTPRRKAFSAPCARSRPHASDTA
ncbi:hypothetical protein ACFYQ5_08385 [Streptomyces sp. NPDC005794]|uniref:hypothetical protein n=1 Tax=Streptomyces sp. NPDC005794 TaxID=3364733 RepID=UPI00369A5F8D